MKKSDQFCLLLKKCHCPSCDERFVLAKLNDKHVVEKYKALTRQKKCNKLF